MKKFLSLVLALVMVTSLLTIGASASIAKDFTDDESITYGEAVDVISAIEVVTGYEDGSFKPTAPLTRGAAAKIITNLILGPATAGNLTCTKAPFPDVPTNHTFAAAIAYCSQNKIINGYSNGFFGPGEPLTGYAFLKMLEGALGYDGAVEGFTGGNWSINVAKIANGIGLTDDLADGFSGTATVDRQTACLFAFNTLKADLVEYPAGTTTAKSVTANTQATTDNNWKNIVNETLTDRRSNRIVQFAERYFPRLVRNNGYFTYNGRYGAIDGTISDQSRDITQDNMARPATFWEYKGQEIGKYKETPAKTYVGSVKINQIYADLGMSSSGNGYLYINGLPFTNGDKPIKKDEPYNGAYLGSVSRGNDTKLSSLSEYYTRGYKDDEGKDAWESKIGDGTLIEVYRNEKTNEVLIAAMSVYGGKIATEKAANSIKDEYVIVEAGSRDPYTANIDELGKKPMTFEFDDVDDFTADGHDEYETTEFKAGQVVGFTYSDDTEEITDMFTLESVEGSLARKNKGSSLTLGDTSYGYSKEYTFEDGLESEENLLNSSEYVVYLDTDGHALWIEEAEFNATAYALIERITNEYKHNVYSDYIGNENFEDSRDGYETNDDGTRGEPIGGSSSNSATSLWDGNRARLLLSDGTVRNVTLDKAYLADKADGCNGQTLKFVAGDVVRYNVNSNGDYRLHNPEAKDHIESLVATNFRIENHVIKGFTSEYEDGKVVGDNSTIIVARNDETESYRVYTGIRNAPTINKGEDGYTAYAYVKDGVAKIVFVVEGKLTNDGKNVTFIAQRSMSDGVTQSDGKDYYEYNAVVKGEITTILVADGVVAGGDNGLTAKDFTAGTKPDKGEKNVGIVFNSTTQDSDDIYTKLDQNQWTSSDTSLVPGEGIRRVNDEEVRIGTANGRGTLLTFANGAKAYTITSGGKIEATEIADVVTNKNTQVYAMTDDGEITALFICETTDRR